MVRDVYRRIAPVTSSGTVIATIGCVTAECRGDMRIALESAERGCLHCITQPVKGTQSSLQAKWQTHSGITIHKVSCSRPDTTPVIPDKCCQLLYTMINSQM